MAADTVNEVVGLLGDRAPRGSRRCRTKRLRLVGADGYAGLVASAGDDNVLRHLADRYGDEASSVLALVNADPALGAPLVAGLPYVKAEAVHAARNEMVRSVDDVLARRTRSRLLARDASADAASDVATLIAAELGWSPEQAEASAAEYRAIIAHERATANLPASSPLPQ